MRCKFFWCGIYSVDGDICGIHNILNRYDDMIKMYTDYEKSTKKSMLIFYRSQGDRTTLDEIARISENLRSLKFHKSRLEQKVLEHTMPDVVAGAVTIQRR